MDLQEEVTATFSIVFHRFDSDGLRVEVAGETTLEDTLGYWQAIVAEVARRHPRKLLLIDTMRGAPLSARQWQQLVATLVGRGLEGVRIAHVKPLGLDRIEYCEIYAVEAGLQARVFADERAAELWLRYGEQATEPLAAGSLGPHRARPEIMAASLGVLMVPHRGSGGCAYRARSPI